MDAFLKFTVIMLIVYAVYYAVMIGLEKLKLSKANSIEGGKLVYAVQAQEPVVISPNNHLPETMGFSQNKPPPDTPAITEAYAGSILYDLGLETINVTGFGVPVAAENLFHHIA